MIVRIFITFILLILISSCKKIENKKANLPNTNPTSYLLKRQTWSGYSTNGQSFLYIYNKDNLVSRIERYNWGNYSVNGGISQTWFDTSVYTFQYVNGLCSKWIVNEKTGGSWYYTFDYNNLNLPIKRTLFDADNNVQSINYYKYDNLNNLIEVLDSADKINFRYDFNYDNKNNLISLVDNILWSNPKQKIKYEYLSFDGKVNFAKAINGLPLTFDFDNNYHSYSSTSPNNKLSDNYYVPVDSDKSYGQPNFTQYTYEYNDENLPTMMKYAGWTVTFEYQKYK